MQVEVSTSLSSRGCGPCRTICRPQVAELTGKTRRGPRLEGVVVRGGAWRARGMRLLAIPKGTIGLAGGGIHGIAHGPATSKARRAPGRAGHRQWRTGRAFPRRASMGPTGWPAGYCAAAGGASGSSPPSTAPAGTAARRASRAGCASGTSTGRDGSSGLARWNPHHDDLQPDGRSKPHATASATSA